MPIVRQVMHFGHPVGKEKHRFKQETPDHADMLRYDLAFHNPADESLVVFPIFKSKNGKYGGGITYARWKSFCMSLTELENVHIPDIDSWITYQHITPGEPMKLTRMTLKEYMEYTAKRDGKIQLWNFA